MSDNIVHVSDASFEDDILRSELPVLIEFWAEWCGPCKMIAPLLDQLSDQYAGKLKVCKMDVDSNPDVPGRYGIRGIPTMMIFKNGNKEATKVGALSNSQLVEFVDSCI